MTMARERKPLWVNEAVNTEVQGSTVYLTTAQSLEANNSQIHGPRVWESLSDEEVEIKEESKGEKK